MYLLLHTSPNNISLDGKMGAVDPRAAANRRGDSVLDARFWDSCFRLWHRYRLLCWWLGRRFGIPRGGILSNADVCMLLLRVTADRCSAK